MPPDTLLDLETEEITTTDALERLAPAGEALWRQAPAATPFQSPAWLLAWWRTFGGADPWGVALRSGGRLVGLVPLFVYTPPETSERTVLFLGDGLSDYLDALVLPGFEAPLAESLFGVLERRRDRWDLCSLQGLRPGSPLLAAAAPTGWADAVTVEEQCPVLALPSAVEALPERVPGGLLKRLRYFRRRAARTGEVRVEQAEAESLGELLEALFRLHGARWATRDDPGVLADEGSRRFHRAAAPALQALGVLRLYAIRLDERIIAVFYGFAHQRQVYYYLSGFDPAWEPLSPGHLVVLHAIEEAVREGAEAFDFLRGQEAYKYAWGAVDRPNHRRVLRHASAGVRKG